MWKKLVEAMAALAGAAASFFCGLPPILWVLAAVMSLDYATGILCGLLGVSPKTEHGGVSSGEAFRGLNEQRDIGQAILKAVLGLL